MKLMKADIIKEIKAARNEARIKASAYEGLAAKQYDYRRAIAAISAYGNALTMFECGIEHQIPDMAVKAIADFEYARNNDIAEMTLAFTDGRRDALATAAEWMNTKGSNR